MKSSSRESAKGAVQTLLLKRIRLKDVRGFRDVDVSFVDAAGKARPMTLALGDNGSGKSTLLRALAIGLCQQDEASGLKSRMAGNFIRVNKQGNSLSRAEIHIELLDPADAAAQYSLTTSVSRDASGQEILSKQVEPEHFPWDAIFVCGYGVNRGPSRRSENAPSDYRRSEALETLFDDDALLLDPENALRAFKLAIETEGQDVYAEVLRRLKRLLQLRDNFAIEVTFKEVKVHGPWGALPFHALGDGYRGTAGWFLDLTLRALIGGRRPGDPGIVLIDEIDEHLHPSWQKELIPLLKKTFPNLQFVGTTHSAMSIVNCGPEELLVSSLANTVSSILPLDSPAGKTADAILRGQWFGLASTLDTASEKVLKAYHKAVESGVPESQIESLRAKLRERLGRLVESPIDEMAIEIANEARRQAREESSFLQRTDRISAAANLLRKRLKMEGVGE